MKAVDTTILVYAQRRELPHHAAALGLLRVLAEGKEPWALPWPCVYEFVRVVAHPRVFRPPTPVGTALEAVSSLLRSPAALLLGEGRDHWHWGRKMVEEGGVIGNLAFDAHIAALLREHGIEEILTADADFHRFPGIRAVNPFAPGAPQE